MNQQYMNTNQNNMPQQPQQIYANNPNWYKPAPKKEDTRWITWFLVGAGAFVVIFAVLLSVVSSMLTKNTSSKDNSKTATQSTSSSSVSTTAATEELTEAITEETTEVVSVDVIAVASDFSNMRMGDVCLDDDLYVGLSYAKLSDTFTTGLGSTEDIAADKQVLFAYFDVYNGGNEKKHVDDNDFTCYVDGTSFSKVDTYFYYEEDDVSNQFGSELYNNTSKLVITDFEIPKEWNEIKLYYGSDCIWTIASDEITSDPFEFKSMYDVDYKKEATRAGAVIYSDEYELTYDGYEYHTEEYSGDNYIVYKFNVNNTGASELDYSLVGYSMECYADNYVTYPSSYTMDDKIGDYVNIYDLDKIQAGMSAKIYVAFEIKGEHSFYRMVYDAGYIADDYLADIYINEETASNTDSE